MATRGRTRADGTGTWLAHWREPNGRQRTRTFYSEAKAKRWEEEMRDARDDHALAPFMSSYTVRLEEWIPEWWRLHISDNPQATRESYARAINKYIAPELGRLKMHELTSGRVAQMRDELVNSGVPHSQVAHAQAVLSSCLGKAVERDLIPSNPCAHVAKARKTNKVTKKQKWPPSPLEIEALRREFLVYRAPNSGAFTALRSATMVTVMGYGGLRPEEVMGLKLQGFDRSGRLLIIEDVFASDHRPGDTKTHYQRVVETVDPLYADLVLWIKAARMTEAGGWMFPPAPGKDVESFTHRNWRSRPFKAARRRILENTELVARHPEFKRTLTNAMPRDLRAGYVSLLARAGHSDPDIAEMSGHSVEVLRRHYMGALRSLRNQPRLDEVTQIQLARQEFGTDDLAQEAARQLAGCGPHGLLAKRNPRLVTA